VSRARCLRLVKGSFAGYAALQVVADRDADLQRSGFAGRIGERNLHDDEAAGEVFPMLVSDREEEIVDALLLDSYGDGLARNKLLHVGWRGLLPIFPGVSLAMMTLSVAAGGTACRPSFFISGWLAFSATTKRCAMAAST